MATVDILDLKYSFNGPLTKPHLWLEEVPKLRVNRLISFREVDFSLSFFNLENIYHRQFWTYFFRGFDPYTGTHSGRGRRTGARLNTGSRTFETP